MRKIKKLLLIYFIYPPNHINSMVDLCTNNFGRTELHTAASRGHLDPVQHLIRNSAQRDACDKFGRTALHYAAQYGYPEIIAALIANLDSLKKRQYIDTTDNQGNTALHVAVLWERVPVIQLLLHEGADKNKKNKQGETPLISAKTISVKGLLE